MVMTVMVATSRVYYVDPWRVWYAASDQTGTHHSVDEYDRGEEDAQYKKDVERGGYVRGAGGEGQILSQCQLRDHTLPNMKVDLQVATIAASNNPDITHSSHCALLVLTLACRNFLFRDRFHARCWRLSLFCCKNSAIDGSDKSG